MAAAAAWPSQSSQHNPVARPPAPAGARPASVILKLERETRGLGMLGRFTSLQPSLTHLVREVISTKTFERRGNGSETNS